MIEVNLLPGGRKGGGGGGNPFAGLVDSLKGLGGGGGGGTGRLDPYMGFCIAAGVVALGYMGYSWFSANGAQEELNVQIEAAVQDSIRNAAIIERTAQLEARGDSIQERVGIIQEIDAGRYVWPHLLDEIAAAVPDFTWLREVLYQSDAPLTVRINGRAGSLFAVTRFMRRLEASRFLRAVNSETMQQIPSEENPDDLVYMFELVVTYESPSIDELETVPLFDDGTTQASTAAPGN